MLPELAPEGFGSDCDEEVAAVSRDDGLRAAFALYGASSTLSMPGEERGPYPAKGALISG